MGNNAKVLWIIAQDAASLPLECADFQAELGVMQCESLKMRNYADGMCLMAIHLVKKKRSRMVVDELMRLEKTRIQTGWIEEAAGLENEGLEVEIDSAGVSKSVASVLRKCEWKVKLHRLPMLATVLPAVKMAGVSATTVSAAISATTVSAAIPVSVGTPVSVATPTSVATLISPAAPSSAASSIKKHKSHPSQNANRSVVSPISSNSSSDDDEEVDLHTILETIRKLKRQVKKALRRPESPAVPLAPKQPQLPVASIQQAPPVISQTPLGFKIPPRPPVHMSLLRYGSVSELYFRGVWVPELDGDDTLKCKPGRARCFRSSCVDYIEGYDIDDVNFEDTLGIRPSVAASPPFRAFVHQRPARGAVLLSTLRDERISALCYTGVFCPDYDIDDLYAGPAVGRPRILKSQLCERMGVPREWSVDLYGDQFVSGYDIDDIFGPRRAAELARRYLLWRERQ